MTTSDDLPSSTTKWPDYRAVWRWHFYAGLYCIPFVIILSLSGLFYLFKTEIESWEERRFESLTLSSPSAGPARQIQAALDSISGSRLDAYELPQSDTSAARVIVRHQGEQIRIFVHPSTLEILGSLPERQRVMQFVRRIHGELLLGPKGSYLVELAASWTIVMILTGLYLWWPRNMKNWGGIIYPRLRSTSKVFWRDLHSVPGLWISGMALILILSGLPWSNFWGDYFRTVRRLTGTAVARQDWSNRGGDNQEERAPAYRGSSSSSDEEHAGHGGSNRSRRFSRETTPAFPIDLHAVDLIAATVTPLNLAPPILISPPQHPNETWTAKSNTPNRPYRTNLTLNGDTGQIVSREDFKDRHLIDRMVGYGIALHEGHLFGIANQVLGLVTALGLVLLSVSGIVLWWQRREPGLLGAPHPAAMPKFSLGIAAIVIALAVYLPMFGTSLIAVLLLERLLFQRIPRLRNWLGLS